METEAPELAALARRFLDSPVHKTLATLRRDGSPRISGTEVVFAEGEMWLGSMWRSLKALDLQRDPRLALHSASADPAEWKGDAKLSGRAEEITDPARIEAVVQGKAPPGPMHLFRLDIDEASTVALAEGGKSIVVTWWTPDAGVRTAERG